MFQQLIVLGLFGGMVWMIAQAIFILLRSDRDADLTYRSGDTLARFVEENYGTRFVAANPLGEEGMRRL
ncbi:MAG: hypothetical protein ABIS45_16265 [Burkholderiales bacterium]